MNLRSLACAFAAAAITMTAGCATGPNDEAIAAAVKQRLSTTKAVEVGKLTIASKGGVVTLSGVQSSLQEKQAAGAFASSIEGVKSVVNHIEVKP